MNFKFFLFALVLILITNISAYDIAYITKTTASPNSIITNIFDSKGYNYVIIKDSRVSLTNFSQYDMIFVEEDIVNRDLLPYDSVNILFFSNKLAQSTWNSGYGQTLKNKIIINNKDSYIVRGVSYNSNNETIIYTTPRTVEYLNTKPGYVDHVAIAPDGHWNDGIISSELNALTKKRTIFFGIPETSYWNANANLLFSNALDYTIKGEDRDNDGYYTEQDCDDSKATVWQNIPGYVDTDGDNMGSGNLWQVCSGETLTIGYSKVDGDCNNTNSRVWRYIQGYRDIDADGLGNGNLLDVCSGNILPAGYSKVDGDCNDTNYRVWQNLPGYKDNDKDEFGAGDLLEVCSGDSLTIGYVNNDLDCNDNNLSINPNGIEIAYNNIDENCDNLDLADVDNDGYCNEGYLIQDASLECAKETETIGTDCNDNDISFNLDSADIYKNCKNDAPFIENIVKIIVQEGNIAEINVNASDPENDELIYSIDDTRFEVNDNILTWQTEYADEGSYNFVASVNDGEFEVNTSVEIQVINQNQLPICNDIEDLEFNEDENYSLNLNDYCSDSDGQELTYSIDNVENLSISINNGIAEIIGNRNFNGEKTISFSVSDGVSSININNIKLIISPIDDSPVLKNPINDMMWNEDVNLTNVIDLNDFFNEIEDQSLIFGVSGNNFITILVNNGLVSLYPQKDWFGNETVVFSASDGNLTAESNPVNLEVGDVNEPPVFNEFNCTTEILEDTRYSCKISSSDIENETMRFTIQSQNGLNCSFNESTLSYIGYKDRIGEVSCILRVIDESNSYSDKLFVVNIENINDAPVIREYSPRTSPKIMNGSAQRFTVFAGDVDTQELVYKWFVNNESVGTGASYILNKTSGNYKVEAVITDNEYNVSQVWNAFVGNINYFTCSEVSGYVCNENQICSQDFLGVYDSERCCPVQCSKKPPKFSEIENISVNLTNNLNITIKKPLSTDVLEVGNTFKSVVQINNNLGSENNFLVEAYLYDITRDRVVKKLRESVRIDSESGRGIEFNFTLDEELKDNRNYALFVRASNKKTPYYYNQNYTELNIKRTDYDVRIKSIEIPFENISCGDSIDVDINVINMGSLNQVPQLKIENSQLGISERTGYFNIENFNKDNEEKKTLTIEIPNNAKEGEYALKAILTYYNETITQEKTINIENCKKETTDISEVETIKISNEANYATRINSSSKTNKNSFALIGLVWSIVLIVVLIMAVIYRNNNFLRNGVVYKTSGTEDLEQSEEADKLINSFSDIVVEGKKKKSKKK